MIIQEQTNLLTWKKKINSRHVGWFPHVICLNLVFVEAGRGRLRLILKHHHTHTHATKAAKEHHESDGGSSRGQDLQTGLCHVASQKMFY